MIENLFLKKATPLILQDCTLFIRLDYYDIGTTYIFTNQITNKVEQFGDEWIKNHIRTENDNKGYFSSPPYLDFVLMNKFIGRNDIAIIGYYKKIRYIVDGVHIGDTRSEFEKYFAAKFRFSEIKQLK